MRIVHEDVDTIGVRFQRCRDVVWLTDVADEMGVGGPALSDELAQTARGSVGPRKAYDIVVCRSEGPGDADAKTFGSAGE
jgi:hypothetical protein